MFKRYSIVMVCNNQDNILVGRRNDSNLYTNPGGGLNKGECPFHGAAREFLEETGLYLSKLVLLGAHITPEKNLIYVFQGFLPEDSLTINTEPDPDKEVSVWEFKDPNEIVDDVHIPVEENLILKYWIDN